MDKLNIVILDRSIEEGMALKEVLDHNDTVGKVQVTTYIEEGIEWLKASAVHIVLLDVSYPDYEGVPALRAILNNRILPIIVLASPAVDQTAKTVVAISHGAIDFIKKIDYNNMDEISEFETHLIQKMQNVSQANRLRSIARKVKENPLKEISKVKKQPVEIIEPSPVTPDKKETIVVIGTSTGGPRALQQVIQQIPKDFNHPILIVQHMPAGFTKSLAERLHNIGTIPVKEAAHEELIQKGVAYVAPGNYQMQVIESETGIMIDLSQGHDHLPHRPSVDLLFKSVANLHHYHKIGVVLTGMGRDGAQGVKEIKKYEMEAVILTESRETSVIDGMPQAVVETNLVTQTLQIEKIGSAIAEYAKKRGK